MNLRTRMLLSVTLITSGTILLLGSLLSWNAYQSLLSQKKEDALNMARLLAKTTAIVDEFPSAMEDAIGEQMVVEATLTAHLVALAEEQNLSSDEINLLLQEIAQETALSEFWVTDENGHAYLRNLTEYDFTFSPNPEEQPQASAFWALLTGEKEIVIQESRIREVDEQSFKYVGVRGVDQPRIVQVGYNATWLERLRQRVGVKRLIEYLVRDGNIRAVRILDVNRETLIFSTTPTFTTQSVSALDYENLQNVLDTGEEITYLDGNQLKVIVPVNTISEKDEKNVLGVTMVYMPTNQLQAALKKSLVNASIVALFVLALSIFGSFLFSNWITKPIRQISEAAVSVQKGEYRSEKLATVQERSDELGNLGKVFDEMAQEVLARDKRLRLLKMIIPMGVELSAEKKFDRLMEMMVIEAQRVTNADGGSLYLLEGDQLRFVILRNSSLGIAMGGETGEALSFPPLHLYDENGKENLSNVATYVALKNERVHIMDAYDAVGFDFSGTRNFDQKTGYRSKSFLTFPLEGDDGSVIGVLQLINAMDAESGEVVPFATDDVTEALALMTSASLAGYIRTEALMQEIDKLRIEIDQKKQDLQVAEITDSVYFKELQERAREVRAKKKGKIK